MILSLYLYVFFFFFSSRRRHTRFKCDWSSDVCSSDLPILISLFAFVTVSVSQYWFTHQSSIKQLLVPQHEATTDKKSQTATPPKWDELLFRLLLVLLCY